MNEDSLHFWRRQDGGQGLAQWPNAPLFVAIIAWVVQQLVPSLGVYMSGIINIALIVWALWEIDSGVSYVRRLLGLGVLIAVVVGMVIN